MAVQSIRDYLGYLTDAPNSIDQLREAFLTLAVRGTLLPQESRDEPGSALLERIRSERAQKLAAGTIPIKRLSPVVDDDIPFALPTTWEWVRLGEICHDLGQTKPQRDFSYIDVAAIDSKRGVIGPNIRVVPAANAPSRARKLVTKGCVLYSTVRPYLLNIAVVERDYDPSPIASTAFGVLQPFSGVLSRFLFYYLRSRPFVRYVETAMTGVAYPAINDAKLWNGLVPLPPTAEQSRIVAKLDELMVLCADLESRQQRRRVISIHINEAALHRLVTASDPAEFAAAWQRVRDNFDLLYAVPENVPKLREAILQLAVQGKLVPQDPNDEPAHAVVNRVIRERTQLARVGRVKKACSFRPLSRQDVSFIYPQSWELCSLGELLAFGPANGISPKPVEHITDVKSLTLSATTSGVFNPRYVKYLACKIPSDSPLWLQDGDILIQRSNTAQYVGIAAVYHGQAGQYVYPDLMMKLRIAQSVDVGFVHLVLNCAGSREFYRKRAAGTSGSMKKINQAVVCSLPVPIPPAAEQKRIVARVSELMALCDDLEAKLKQQRDHADRLAQAIVNSVVNGQTSVAI